MMRPLSCFAVLCLVAALCRAAGGAVIINGTALDPGTHRALELRYGNLLPGTYWYDAASGLWGLEGGPSVGQIVPGLQLGPLAADASVKAFWQRTFVFVNGREIHPREYAYLYKLFGNVNPGRYWLNSRGVAGHEGGPPQFDLRAAAMARAAPPAGGGHGRRGAFGNTGSDGRCSYYNDVESGASVMVGDC
jgi:hypothetical protein